MKTRCWAIAVAAAGLFGTLAAASVAATPADPSANTASARLPGRGILATTLPTPGAAALAGLGSLAMILGRRR